MSGLTPRSNSRRRGAALVSVALAVGFGASLLFTLAPAAAGRAAAAEPAQACPASPPTDFGEPQWVLGCGIGGQGFTSPTVGTIDGTPVVVDASLTGWVYVVNALTGEEMPGWPQAADLVGTTPTAIDSSPAIAYLDGPDAEPSIVVGLGSLYVKDQNGGLMAWNADGTVRFRFQTRKTFSEWPHQPDDWSNSVFATPAIGDITGSGQQDIVFGSYDHLVYALNPEGHLLPGFPLGRQDTIWSSPALADTTHSGKMDIIEGGDSSGWRGPTGGKRCFSGWLSDYRYSNGRPRLVWEHCLAETVWSSPAVSTFGSTPVVVVGTSWFTGKGRDVLPAEDEVFAFNAATGAPIKGWPVNAGGPSFGSPAIAPLVPGGPDDVIESSCADCLKGPSIVSAWNESGQLLWRTDLNHSELLASPAVADVQGPSSASNDVLIGNVAGLYVLDGSSGDKVDGTSSHAINRSCNVGGTAVVAPVAGSQSGYMLFTNCGFNGPNRPTNAYLRAYNIPAESGPAPWPMFRANAQRTGVPDPQTPPSANCASSSIATGLLVVGEAGTVRGYGGASNCGGLGGRLLPENVAGVAATPDGAGYWIVLGDGAVYAFGDAQYYGDMRTDSWLPGSGDGAAGDPTVGIASDADGKGYYLLAGDGSVYAFGDAQYWGSPGIFEADGKPVGIATDPATGGYWVATSTGQVYAYGAPSYGSQLTGHSAPIVGIAAAPDGAGYWLVASNGAVFGLGVPSYGSASDTSVRGIAADGSDGYYLVSEKGEVYGFGSADEAHQASRSFGSEPVAAVASG